MAPSAATKKTTSSIEPLLALHAQGRALRVVLQQHLLREDQVAARVVGQLEVVAHRDRVERAGHLAVAAEDAAQHVDLVDLRVALAGRDLVLGGVLGGDDADAIGRAGGGAERATDALLEPRVLEPVELVLAAEARVDGQLLLGVLHGDGTLDDAHHRGLQALERHPESAVDGAGTARLRAPRDLVDVVGVADLQLAALVAVHHCHGAPSTTITAVTSAFAVARGSSTFQPNDISWS